MRSNVPAIVREETYRSLYEVEVTHEITFVRFAPRFAIYSNL